MAIQLFLSYRRSDSRAITECLYQWLRVSGVPLDAIFFDTSSIVLGSPFPQMIVDAIYATKVMIVVIGPDWINARDPDHHRQVRLREHNDWVRQEIALALRLGRPVIPLLIDGTKMPKRHQLPKPLQPLCDYHALQLGTDSDAFARNMQSLVQALQDYLPELYLSRREYLQALVVRYQDVTLPVVGILSLNGIYQPLQLRRDPLRAVELEKKT